MSKASQFAHLDDAKLSWFHIRAVLISGVGFFGDAYDVFVIGLALPMLYRVYYPPANPNAPFSPFEKQHQSTDALIKMTTTLGNLIGQLGFGYLGDVLGRKKMYGVELIIMIIATLGSCLAADAVRGFSVLTLLGIWRFILGVGIGGDYPMSATITSEFAIRRYRGMMVAAVFAMQGIGILGGGLVAVSTLAALKSRIDEDPLMLDYAWRFLLGFGVVPALFTVYFRMTIPETPRFTANVKGDSEQMERDLEKVLGDGKSNGKDFDGQSIQVIHNASDSGTIAPTRATAAPTFWQHYSKMENFKILFGVSYAWFALDVAWYGLSLNSSVILRVINYAGSNNSTVFEYFYQKSLGALIMALLGSVPGYWVTVALIERMGRKAIQFLGFAVITVVLVILSIFYHELVQHGIWFVVLFTIANFFFNFGPNQTTFIIPSEVFPTRWRSTGHGLAAASGKLGAILGTTLVANYFDSAPQVTLGILAFVMLTGFLVTFLIPETAGRTLEEITGEEDL